MRKRGPLIIGAGIALLVASQYLDFGLGFQDGSGPGDGTDPNSQVSLDTIVRRTPAKAVPDPAEETATVDDVPRFVPTIEPQLPDVVDIMIDGNQYLVLAHAGEQAREAMTLDQIVAMTATVDGEPSGIRVRVARTPNAVASAEAAVMKRLADAGLAADQIDARRQLVEPN